MTETCPLVQTPHPKIHKSRHTALSKIQRRKAKQEWALLVANKSFETDFDQDWNQRQRNKCPKAKNKELPTTLFNPTKPASNE